MLAVSVPARQAASSAVLPSCAGLSVVVSDSVTAFRPPLNTPMRPVKPVLSAIRRVPETVVAVSEAGAVMAAPTLACTGMRTERTPSFQTKEPNCQTPSVAVDVVKRTVKVADAPGAKVNEAGVTKVVKPGTVAVDVKVAAAAPTLVTRRVTVTLPVTDATVMEGRFRL